MTFKEYIKKTTAKFGLDSEDVDVLLVNQADIIPDPNAEVNARIAKIALCNEFAMFLQPANISEGGYSITWNIEAIKLWYNATTAKLGLKNYAKPALRNKSNIW